MNRRFLTAAFVLMVMCAFRFVMMPSVNAQLRSSAGSTVAMTYEQEENPESSAVYTSTADYLNVCFSPCNLFFTASQPVTWTVFVNGAPSISPPKKAVTSTLTAEEGIYRIYYSAAFQGGPIQQAAFDIQIIGAPVPNVSETTCLTGFACVISLRLGAPWPEGQKGLFKVKTSGALYDLYYYTADRKMMLLQVIPGNLVRRIPVDITLTAGNYTTAKLSTVVNVVDVKMSVKLPVIVTAHAAGQ